MVDLLSLLGMSCWEPSLATWSVRSVAMPCLASVALSSLFCSVAARSSHDSHGS